jgi:multiple sugar transport system substrate-binding protein
VARAGGLAAILQAKSAPAYAPGTSLHWLRWNDFVPASDEVLRKEIISAEGARHQVDARNDQRQRHPGAHDLGHPGGYRARRHLRSQQMAAAYADSVVDVSDVCEEIAKAQDAFYKESTVVARNGRKWIAVPWCVLGALVAYRKSWFDEVGQAKFPERWEEYREVGKKLKAKGRPIGQTLGHNFGDAPTFSYAYLWSWGGKEVEADGKTVVLNTKPTVDSVKFMTAFWKEAHDEGGLAWDDTNNNRAFLSGTISATLNGASIDLLAKSKPETYLTEKGTPLWQDILHAPLPKGAAGQFGYHPPMSNMRMGYSKNQKAGKDFIRWVTSKEIYQNWFNSQQDIR